MLVSIARENSEDRFRAKIHLAPGGPAVFITARKSGSISRAKQEAEQVFGVLEWRAPGMEWEPNTKLIAEVKP